MEWGTDLFVYANSPPPPPPPTHTHTPRGCSPSPTDRASPDGPARNYLTLDHIERNQLSVTSGNLALYEVSVGSSLAFHENTYHIWQLRKFRLV